MSSSPAPASPSAPSSPSDPGPSASFADAAWLQELETLAAASLPDFLLRQRWYPAKDAGAPRILGADLVPVTMAQFPAAVGVWEVEPPGRPPLLLFIGLARVAESMADPAHIVARLPAGAAGGAAASGRAGSEVLVEAFSVDAFVREWVTMLLRETGGAGGTGGLAVPAGKGGAARLVSGRTRQAGQAGLAVGGEWAVRRSRAEQSNTSIRVGERAIMKVIRKLEEGVNPELEVGRFLTEQAGFEATPAMLAWAELERPGGTGGFTLSVMQAFVPNQGDGWEWVLGRLADAAAGGENALPQATAWLARLGERTAQMHRAFAIDSSDPDFAPEPVREQDLRAWSEAAHAMGRRALDGLEQGKAGLTADARAGLESLQSRQRLLEARLDELLHLQSTDPQGAADPVRGRHGFCRTRHHGDFHLGQVLVAGDDAMIVDFEGEPMRPLAERRAKHAALRDVAGLLRSLSYAAAAGARSLPAATDEMQRAAVVQRLAQWERQATRSYLDAYLKAAEGIPSCPAGREAAERVVRFFMLEKALYEVGYELANRPDWVDIPLRGILQLLEGGERGEGGGGALPDGRAPAGAQRIHRMPFGAEINDDGSVRFRLWAPSHAQVRLELDARSELLPMQRLADGWHELRSGEAGSGSTYRFVLPDGMRVPDPASRFQPQDVHGPSEVIDPRAYRWGDADWKGRAWEEAVVYELHVGAFTPAGTFAGIIGRLDHLVSLGVTALEIMPVADFPGERNWGYDGVLPFAPDGAYGRPEDFKALVDAAHSRGLMVLLDVVYNHFGPEGAYQHAIAPEIFTDRHKTPWGAAINTDGVKSAPVREYFIHNALYWIEEFHLDGLRLDAVHAILDDSPRHLLTELAERVRAAAPQRQVHLVLENEENQASRLVRDERARPRWYSAQWNDDVHHVLHVAASGEAHGYYGDYHGDTAKLGRALAQGFAFQGEVMPYRGHGRGEASGSLPPSAFVAFMQNHDQVGNRAFGERLTAIASRESVRAVAAVYLLLPQIPMIFMGEEWAAAQPFPFFCDFGPELADAVRKGRRQEFARFPEFQDPARRERIPDPVSRETFASAKLGWDDRLKEPHAGWLDWYRRVLAVRHAAIVPALRRIRRGGNWQVIGDGAVVVRWRLDESEDGAADSDRGSPDRGGELVLAANLSRRPCPGFPPPRGRVLWQEGGAGEQPGALAAWSVRWTLEDAAGGERKPLDRLAQQMGIEASFQDARGKTVRTEERTQRQLLAAMGVAATDDNEVEQALDSLEAAEWLRALPPVQVLQVTEGAPAVEVVQPAQTAELRWRVCLEAGGEHDGRVRWKELALVEEKCVGEDLLQRRRLPLPPGLPWGYHRLAVEPGEAVMSLVITPGTCWLPDGLADGRRLWGIAAQLYLLRSASDWGIGDYGDLHSLVDLAARRKADVIGLNPLHAMFPDAPEHASPYSPASRLLLNVLNIDVTAVPELTDCPDAVELISSQDFQQRLETCRAQRLVDYRQVSALKMPVLRKLFDACRQAENGARRKAFDGFRRELGEVLERNCLYFALREHFANREPALPDWHDWPSEFRDPASPAVARFAQEHRDDVDFVAWLQWIADTQLGAAAAAARAGGMAIGLYRDLAVGADRAGAETWANAGAVVSEVQVGAPPDIFNPTGQDWGLPPFQPRALREEGYRSFIELIRANMRHAGGLRIDHVMGLQHLYWVPAGQQPSDGAYVQYPLEDLVGILALESHRQRCLVVGEDLGTVPQGFRERMEAARILSYRVLFFEKDDEGGFLPPADYPPLALAVIGSHDLPTLRGWWEGRDLAIKQSLGLYPDEEEERSQRKSRQHDRQALLKALRSQGLLPPTGEPEVEALSKAAHAFLARSPSALAMAQLDDLTDEAEPVNVPATSHEHPNWRRRHSMTLEQLAGRAAFQEITAIFRSERGAGGPNASA